MNTDNPDLHGCERTRLLLKDETHRILGCAFDVLNEVGHGFHEKIYENALVVAFEMAKIPFDQQKLFPVLFRNRVVGEFIPDLVAFASVIVDAKVIERIAEIERGKMINYLRISKLRVGLILNFKNPTLEWIRVVV